MVLYLVILVILLLAAPAWAATRFVSPSGSGSACTQGRPCGLQPAIDRSGAGDTVMVGSGQYHQDVNVHHSGAPGRPITIRPATPGEVAHIVTVENGFNIFGSHVVLDAIVAGSLHITG